LDFYEDPIGFSTDMSQIVKMAISRRWKILQVRWCGCRYFQNLISFSLSQIHYVSGKIFHDDPISSFIREVSDIQTNRQKHRETNAW